MATIRHDLVRVVAQIFDGGYQPEVDVARMKQAGAFRRQIEAKIEPRRAIESEDQGRAFK